MAIDGNKIVVQTGTCKQCGKKHTRRTKVKNMMWGDIAKPGAPASSSFACTCGWVVEVRGKYPR